MSNEKTKKQVHIFKKLKLKKQFLELTYKSIKKYELEFV